MIPTVLLRYDRLWAEREDAQVVKLRGTGGPKIAKRPAPKSSWAANPKGR